MFSYLLTYLLSSYTYDERMIHVLNATVQSSAFVSARCGLLATFSRYAYLLLN